MPCCRSQRWGARGVLIGLTLVAVAVFWLLPAIPQDPAYHRFADSRPLLGIPNSLNVISNVPFLIFGVLGLRALFETRSEERKPLILLFVGVALTSIGSAYYHLAPDSQRLVWDRLPMTVVFMSAFAWTIGERVSHRLGSWLLPPLIATGIASIVYWIIKDDLRLYGLVQYYALLAIGLLLFLFPARYSRGADLLAIGGWYLLAKLLEVLDGQIFALTRVVSGHTLKHLAAAAAIYWLIRMIQLRRPIAWVSQPADL